LGEKKLEETGSRQSGEIEWTDFYSYYILRVLYRVKRCSINSMTTFLNNQIGQYLDLFVSHRASGHFVPSHLVPSKSHFVTKNCLIVLRVH